MWAAAAVLTVSVAVAVAHHCPQSQPLPALCQLRVLGNVQEEEEHDEDEEMAEAEAAANARMNAVAGQEDVHENGIDEDGNPEMSVVLHEDKKYYPSAEETFGTGTETLVMEEDAQALEVCQLTSSQLLGLPVLLSHTWHHPETQDCCLCASQRALHRPLAYTLTIHCSDSRHHRTMLQSVQCMCYKVPVQPSFWCRLGADVLQVPIIAPVKQKKLEVNEQAALPTFYSSEFLAGLMTNPELVRNVAVIGHLHHGKSLVRAVQPKPQRAQNCLTCMCLPKDTR